MRSFEQLAFRTRTRAVEEWLQRSQEHCSIFSGLVKGLIEWLEGEVIDGSSIK